MQAESPVNVVFVTAQSDPKTRAAATQPAGFVTKPFSCGQLLDAVAAAGTYHSKL